MPIFDVPTMSSTALASLTSWVAADEQNGSRSLNARDLARLMIERQAPGELINRPE